MPPKNSLDMTKPAAVILLILLLGAIYAFAVARAAEPDFSLSLDQAKLMRLPAKAVTIVIGNPLIADASAPGPGGVIVVTAKSFGRTNIIFADANGNAIAERWLIVGAATHGVVTVTRGMARQTYTCNPVCEQTPALGDDAASFKSELSQIGARIGASTITPEKAKP